MDLGDLVGWTILTSPVWGIALSYYLSERETCPTCRRFARVIVAKTRPVEEQWRQSIDAPEGTVGFIATTYFVQTFQCGRCGAQRTELRQSTRRREWR